jgi:hypothetical protein
MYVALEKMFQKLTSFGIVTWTLDNSSLALQYAMTKNWASMLTFGVQQSRQFSDHHGPGPISPKDGSLLPHFGCKFWWKKCDMLPTPDYDNAKYIQLIALSTQLNVVVFSTYFALRLLNVLCIQRYVVQSTSHLFWTQSTFTTMYFWMQTTFS